MDTEEVARQLRSRLSTGQTFQRIIEWDASNSGLYEVRLASGDLQTRRFRFEGDTLRVFEERPMPTCPIGPTCLGCAKCDPEYHAKRAAKRAAEFRTATEDDGTPPDPWAASIAKLQREEAARRAAREPTTPERRFEDLYRKERQAEFEKEYEENNR